MFLLHLLSKRLKQDNIKKDKKTDRLLTLLCTDKETDRYLDCAENSSYKQVGVLVNVQDCVGCGRVGAGRGRHHTSHGAFQRIHWDGAIQPITEDREKQKERTGLMLFCLLCCISWRTFTMFEDIGAWNQFFWTLGATDEWWKQGVEPVCCSGTFGLYSDIYLPHRSLSSNQEQHFCVV